MHSRLVALAVFLFLAAAMVGAQPGPEGVPDSEVPFNFLSAEVVRFAKPLRFGAGPRATELKQALLVKVQVQAPVYERLPPDIEPFLYVGRRELRTFEVRPERSGELLTITYYTTDLRPARRWSSPSSTDDPCASRTFMADGAICRASRGQECTVGVDLFDHPQGAVGHQ